MTQNADALLRDTGRQKIRHLAEKIITENITLIAMQNVAQSPEAEPISPEMWEDQAAEEGMCDIRTDNPAAMLAQFLKQCGKSCSWIWLSDSRTDDPRKTGSAFLSVGRRIRCVDRFALGMASQTVLGVQLEGMEDWFYQLSANAWDAPKERFLSQWKLLNGCITSKRLCSTVWLIGDTGSAVRENRRNYETIIAGGWSEVHAGKSDFSNVWCSRKREIKACGADCRKQNGQFQFSHSGMIIDVKEDTL